MSNDLPTTQRLWELLSARLRSFLLKRISDEQVAEDLLQETFVRIHQKLSDLDDAERITPWVFQIARNLVIDHYRSKSRNAVSLSHELEVDDEAENVNAVVAAWLPQMLSRLPEKYREAVELYELSGLSQQEIADRLSLSLSGAKSRVQRGREQLKALFLDCCSYERDRRGNLIGYRRKEDEHDCYEGCC